jgi:hypothetical protein
VSPNGEKLLLERGEMVSTWEEKDARGLDRSVARFIIPESVQ